MNLVLTTGLKTLISHRKGRIVYNGHKREHALKFQSVAIPNGLIAYMFGPVGSAIEQY